MVQINFRLSCRARCSWSPRPIGNLEDITARALRVLREVSLIAAEDTRRTAHLLARYAITTPTTSLHEHNEEKKGASLVERLRHGESIALVSDAGTPTVSDPGQRLIAAAIEAGIRVEPIPGPSAALAALAASGLPTDTFLFLGFPPIKSKDRLRGLRRSLRDSHGGFLRVASPHPRHAGAIAGTSRRLSGGGRSRADQGTRRIGQRTNFRVFWRACSERREASSRSS